MDYNFLKNILLVVIGGVMALAAVVFCMTFQIDALQKQIKELKDKQKV